MKVDSNIKYFLDFPRNNSIYNKMAEEAIDVLLNLELLYKNKIRLDLEYHEPDNFLLESNNLIRNAIFVIEKATKSKTQYPWLKNYIHEFIQDNKNDYQILKTMRNNC